MKKKTPHRVEIPPLPLQEQSHTNLIVEKEESQTYESNSNDSSVGTFPQVSHGYEFTVTEVTAVSHLVETEIIRDGSIIEKFRNYVLRIVRDGLLRVNAPCLDVTTIPTILPIGQFLKSVKELLTCNSSISNILRYCVENVYSLYVPSLGLRLAMTYIAVRDGDRLVIVDYYLSYVTRLILTTIASRLDADRIVEKLSKIHVLAIPYSETNERVLTCYMAESTISEALSSPLYLKMLKKLVTLSPEFRKLLQSLDISIRWLRIIEELYDQS